MGTSLLLLLCLVGATTSQEFDTEAPPMDYETTDIPETSTDIESDTTTTNITHTPILRQINRVNDDGSYTFGFESADGTFKVETRDADGNVHGKYGFLDEFGELKVVEYKAGNETGFEHDSDLLPQPAPVPPVPQFSQVPQDFHSSFPVAPPKPPPRPHFVPQRAPQFQRNEIPQAQPAFVPRTGTAHRQAQPQAAPRPLLVQSSPTPVAPRPQPVPAPQSSFGSHAHVAPGAQSAFVSHPHQNPFAPRPQGFPQSQPQFFHQPQFARPQLPSRPQFPPQPQFSPYSQFAQRPKYVSQPQSLSPRPVPQPVVTRKESSPPSTKEPVETSLTSSASKSQLPASTAKLPAQPERPQTQRPLQLSPQFNHGLNRFLPQQQQRFVPQQFAQPQPYLSQQLGSFGGFQQLAQPPQPLLSRPQGVPPRQVAWQPQPQSLTPQFAPQQLVPQ